MSFDASRIKKNRRNCESHQQTFLQREMKRKKKKIKRKSIMEAKKLNINMSN